METLLRAVKKTGGPGPSAAILAGVTVSACGVLSARTPTSWIAHVLARIGERGRANKRGVRALEEVAIRP
jgi:hypothetical protein